MSHQSFLRNPKPFPSFTDAFPRVEILNGPAFFETLTPRLDAVTRIDLPTFLDLRKKNPMREP